MNGIPVIDPEFKEMIPPLAPEEFEQLEQNITSKGNALTRWWYGHRRESCWTGTTGWIFAYATE
jgi:hypothetical protein